MMAIDTELLGILLACGRESKLEYVLYLQGRSYPLDAVSIADSPTAVTRPTVRGGVYFSEKSAYRISGTVSDMGIVGLLSGAMLGPSPEFEEVRIRTSFCHDGRTVRLRMLANITSSVQHPSRVELHMTLIGLVPD